MTVIITEKGKNAQKLDRQDFTDEKELQEYIYENPEALPMYEIDEDIKVLILMREFPTNSGSIDAIGVDINGNIYIVETKLYKNADKRLVVAQALDYGAAIWAYYNDFSDFLTKIDTGTNKRFGMGMNQKIQEFFQFEDATLMEDLLENVKQNLNKGIFRFVVLMDHLEDRLKDLILFINKNSQFDVFAVELEYYKFKDHELMIPKLFGNEIKKDIDVATARSASQRKKWNEEMFFEDLPSRLSNSQIEPIRNLYSFFKKNADFIKWGSGSAKGSFNPVYERICPRSVITVWSDGQLTINYGWLNESDIAEKFRDVLKAKINAKFTLDLHSQYHNYLAEEWVNEVDWICATINDTVKEVLEH